MSKDAMSFRELWEDWMRENRVTPSLLPLLSYLCAIVPLVYGLGVWGIVGGFVVFVMCLCMPVGKKRILLAGLYSFGWVQCSPLPATLIEKYDHYLLRNECHVEMRLMVVENLPQKKNMREVMKVVEIKDMTGEWHPCSGKILVRFGKEQTIPLNYGDTIEARGALLCLERLPNAADGYIRHLRSLGVSHVLSAQSVYVDDGKPGFGWQNVLRQFNGLRVKIGEWLTEGMTEECGNLFQAMMLGRKDLFPMNVREHFLRSSSLHVFAISGLHIGIICAILMKWVFPRLGFGPVTGGIAGIIVCLCYVIMTGSSPSSVRSAVMIFLVALPAALHRGKSLHHALCLAALVELIFNPMLLTHSGFLFSFLVVTVLVCSRSMMTSIRELVFEKWRWKPFRATGMAYQHIADRCFTMGIAMLLAWLVSTPLMLYLNGLFPLGALLIAIPVQLVALCLVWGAVIKILIACCSSWLSCLSGQVLDLMMRVMVGLAMLGGDESFCFHHRRLTGIEVSFCILPTMLLLWFWRLRYLRVAMVSVIVFWICAVAMNTKRKETVVIASFGDDGDVPAVCLCDEKGCHVLCCGSLSSAACFREELSRRGISELEHVSIAAAGDIPRGASLLCKSFNVRSLTLQTDTRSERMKELLALTAQGTHVKKSERSRAGQWNVCSLSGELKQVMVGSLFNLEYVCGPRRIFMKRLGTGQWLLIVRDKGVAYCKVRSPSSRCSSVSFKLND